MTTASHVARDEMASFRATIRAEDVGRAAAMASMRRLALPWFQPRGVPEQPDRSGEASPHWLLLEQVRGPTLGSFVLSRTRGGFAARLVPAEDCWRQEIVEVGTFATVGDAVPGLGNFLRRVTDGRPDLGSPG